MNHSLLAHLRSRAFLQYGQSKYLERVTLGCYTAQDIVTSMTSASKPHHVVVLMA